MHSSDSDTAEYPFSADDAEPLAPPVRVTVSCGGASHPGLVRTENEDHFIVARLTRSLHALITNVPAAEVPAVNEVDGYVLAVADGLGGQNAGARASRLAIRTGLALILGSSTWTLTLGPRESGRLLARMKDYFLEIDRSFRRETTDQPGLAGMATTFTVAYTIGLRAFVVHVGDSRVYRFRAGRLDQLTRDHTVAQSLADSGMITPEELRHHARRHVLTNVISGRPGDLHPDPATHELQIGDALLLCSDGLHDLVEHEEIAATLGRHPEPQAACDALIEAALRGGGRDNVTVVVAKYESERNG